jgi:HEAT repeat protein
MQLVQMVCCIHRIALVLTIGILFAAASAIACGAENRQYTDADYSASRIASLRQRLDQASIRTRVVAMDALAEIGPEARDAIPRMIELLADDTLPVDPGDRLLRGVPEAARESLWHFGPQVGAPLTQTLTLQAPDVRRRSYELLAWLGHVARESLDWLVSEYQNAGAQDRDLLLAAIAKVDSRGDVAIPLLLAGLSDPDRTVRVTAAKHLDRTGLELPAFVKALHDSGAARWMAQEAGQSRERDIVDALLRTLEDTDPEVRAVAIRSLVTYRTFSQQVVPPLLSRLADAGEYSYWISNHLGGSGSVATDAARGLARFPEQADHTLPELFKVATDPDSPAFWDAGFAVAILCEHVPEFLPKIISALGDDPGTPILAALARVGPRAAAAESRLAELMRSEDADFRPIVATALVCVDGGRNKDALRIVGEALRDEDSRRYVCDFIEQAGPHAAPLMPALLEHIVDEERKEWLNWDVTTAIESIGPAAIDAAPLLIARLDTDLSMSLGVDALFAIGPATHPLLADALQDGQHSGEHNLQVLELLVRFGPDAAPVIPSIVPHITSKYPRVREAAARALGAIGSQPELSLPALGQAIGDPRPFVRAAAAASLAAFSDHVTETVPQLVNALGDEYLDVRVAATSALGQLGPLAQSALPALETLKDDSSVLLSETAAETIDRILKP